MGKSLVRLLLWGTVCFLTVFLGLCLYHILHISPWFAVEDIRVSGIKRLRAPAVIAMSGLSPGINIFSADLKQAAQRIAAHPLVEEVRMRRLFPRSLAILVKEWEPVAFFSAGDRAIYVDPKGKTFSGWGKPEGVPRITLTRGGEALLARGAEALMLVDNEPSEVFIDGMEGVTLAGSEGQMINLGSDMLEIKIERMRRIMKILGERKMVAGRIDLGFADRAFVRLTSH